jgi:ectoine hydroxylase-related dioxygenase (phytanoyl-CoA dioxygenase family)
MMPNVEFNMALREGMKATFDEQGFVTIDRITTEAETSWLRGVYDTLLVDRLSEATRRPEKTFLATGNTLWISLDRWESVVLKNTALCRNAVRLASGLLNTQEDAISADVRFFFKPARGGRPVPWHQDEAHQDPAFDHHSLNVWVPFDASTEENGCLWYIPGSHRGGIRLHRHPGNGAPEVALMTDDVPACEAVSVPLAAGGASFHHCRTLHASGTNTTGGHRRALVVVCRAPATIREKPADRPWLTQRHVPRTSF